MKFLKLVELSNVVDGNALEKLSKRIENINQEQRNQKHQQQIIEYLLGVPQPSLLTGFKKPNIQKFAEMVLFFSNDLKPWKTKLNKLLFYADFTHFKSYGTSISGVIYRAIPMGPVPDKFQSIYEFLATEKVVVINSTYFTDGGLGERFSPSNNRTFNPTIFTENELSILNSISDRFKDTSTSEIIEISHQEKAWIENNENRNEIDYFYAFDLN